MRRLFTLVACAITLTSCSDHAPAGLERWLEQWEVVRSCLLSESIGPDTFTNVAITGLVSPHKCLEELPQVSWPHVPADGSALAIQWRIAVDLVEELGKSRLQRSLAIDRIELMAAELRRELGMPAISTKLGPPLPRLAIGQVISIGGEALKLDLDHPLSFSNGVITGQVNRGAVTTDFVIEKLDDVHAWEHPTGTVLAYPSGSWYAGDGSTEVAELLITEGSRQQHIPLPGTYRLVGALDHGMVRMVVLASPYSCFPSYTVAVSTDTGRHWRLRVGEPHGALIGADQDRRTGSLQLILATSGLRRLHLLEVGTPLWSVLTEAKPVELPATAESRYAYDGDLLSISCRANASWSINWWAPSRVQRIDKNGFATLERDYRRPAVVDCRGDAAVLLGEQPDRLERCTLSGCELVLERPPGLSLRAVAGLLENGSWIYAATLDGVVGVWREGVATPSFFTQETPAKPVAITVLHGLPYLVTVDTARVYHFVRIPLPE